MKWTATRHHDVLEAGICRHLHRVRVAHIVERLATAARRPDAPLAILDIGCGDGVITRRLRECFPEATIEAIDVDPVRLDRARAYCAGVTFRQGDVRSLPYEERTFDAVVCHHVLEHVGDDARALKECWRVLVPGGLLILGVPHEGGAVGRMLRRMHRRLYAQGEHVNFYTIPAVFGLLAEHGFTQIQCAKFGFLFPQYWVHLLLLGNPVTFRVGHWISQCVGATADSLIFSATRHGAHLRSGE